MSKITVSRFYKKSTASNIQVVFVPDFEESECSGIETESDDDIPLSHLPSANTSHTPDIETESDSSVIESDTEDDQPLVNLCHNDVSASDVVTEDELTCGTQNPKVGKDFPSRWRKRHPHHVISDYTGEPFPDPPLQDLSPRQYFDMFFDESLYEIIVDQTNLYSTQVTGKSIDTNILEMEQFIGILITMGIVKYPQYRMYWSQYTKCDRISEIMSLKRFENLKRFFHVSDNSEMPKKDSPNYDVLYKVRPLLDSLQEKCRSVPPEECHSIDEQYLPNKPNKWGIKVWARCGISGFLYDFSVYLGKQETTDVVQRFGKIGAIVLKLSEHLTQNVGHKLYMDNLFSGLDLFSELKSCGIWAVGTIRNNRLKGAEKIMKSKKELVKEGRGSMDYRVDANTNTTVIRWIDNGMVQALSTIVGPELGEKIERWSSKKKQVVSVPCPEMIHQYNKHMGGVDLCDMLLSLYRIQLGSKKWYTHIVYYCIGVAVTNAWVIYKRHCAQNGVVQRSRILTLLEFQARIADSLLRQNKTVTRRGRPRNDSPVMPKRRRAANTVVPAEDIRFDNVGHLPIFNDKQSRCKQCKTGYSRILCIKCKVALCMVTVRNCFMDYHTS